MDNQDDIDIFTRDLQEGREKVKYAITENPQVFCEHTISTLKGDPLEIIWCLSLILQVVQLSDDDEVMLFQEMIKTIKADKSGVFLDKEVEELRLLSYFESQYKGAKQKVKYTAAFTNEFVNKVRVIFKQQMSRTKGRPKSKPQVTYDDLFVNKEHGKIIESRLKTNEFIDSEGRWCGHSKAKNELAVLFHLLKNPDSGISVIKSGDVKNQIVAFYQAFGLQVANKMAEGIYCTLRNVVKEPSRRDAYRQFLILFSDLIGK